MRAWTIRRERRAAPDDVELPRQPAGVLRPRDRRHQAARASTGGYL